MKAMILAAGRGQRMGELTEATPKPLLEVNGSSLIEQRLNALAKAGIKEVMINTWHLSESIQAAVGNGKRFGLTVDYSVEQELLNTGGGIKQALPFFNGEPFLLTSSDVVTSFPYSQLLNKKPSHAHLVLVDYQKAEQQGQFDLQKNQVYLTGNKNYIFSGIGVINPALLAAIDKTKFSLMEALQPAIEKGEVSGEYYAGWWRNINHPEDLAALKI